MADLIDRQALLKRISDNLGSVTRWVVKKIILDAPTIEAEPVRHGWWEWFEEWTPSTPDNLRECYDCGWRCSKCKTSLEDMVGGYWDDPDQTPKLNYCPSCGTKMDLEVTGNV